MPKRSRKPPAADFNQLARRIVDQATGVSTAKPAKKNAAKKKDPAAVALGRKGGLKGGPARAAKLTKEQLSESGRKAALARWAAKRP
jgi:hypothetical protein